VHELAERLNSLGCRADILAATGRTNAANVNILCGDQASGRTSFRLFGRALNAYLAIEKYDIIHSTLPYSFADIYQPRGGSFAEAVERNVASYDSPVVRAYKTATSHFNMRRTVLLHAERRLCGPEHKIVVAALSEYVKSQFVRHYDLPAERIQVIPNAVNTDQPVDGKDVDAVRATIFKQSGLSSAARPVLFLFAANNFRLKGLQAILHALKLLKNGTEPHPVLVIVAGSGRADPYLRLAADLEVTDRVLFLGGLDNIGAVLCAADAAVLPTFYDPCSRFILEALSQAKPVITTRFNGAAERYVDGRHGAIIEDPRDARALAKALAWLADGAARRSAAEAIRLDNLVGDISIARHAERMVDLYKSIMASRGKHS